MRTGLVARLRSSRDDAVTYEVTIDAAGNYRCECAGFAFRETCRHVVQLKILRALPVLRDS